jgi:2-octaprenyl-6-methoxyphenol hydroxylase
MQKMHTKKSPNPNQHYDVVIVGGGPSGCALACLLGKQGIKTACIDQENPALPVTDAHDGRTTAVSYGSSDILKNAGVWDRIESQGCPIEDIHIMDSGSPALLTFLVKDVGEEAFGWIFENRILRGALFETMKRLPAITHLAPAHVVDYDLHEDHVCIILKDHPPITAKLVVGCDGRQSFTREWMGIGTRGWSYDQYAIVCTVRHENPHGHIAVEDFRPEGPFAILPMQDDSHGHRSSIVWTNHGHARPTPMDWNDETFNAALNVRFPAFYGRVERLGKRFSYPLGLIHAHRYTGPRMALVGDAAHGIHPIAGQGLNMGLRDVAALADLLGNEKNNKGDFGSESALKHYESARRLDTLAMVAATDQLNALFSNRNPLLRPIRMAGLRLVQKIAPARQFFMKQAMGLSPLAKR